MNKRGISEVVGYVLLVIIAIALAILVYAWLKGFMFKPQVSCPENIAIGLDGYSCANNKITLNLRNTGFFNIDGFLARVGNTTKGKAVYFLKDGNDIDNFIINANKTLAANELYSPSFDYHAYNSINKIEIEPFKMVDKDIVLCDGAIIRQDIKNCGIGGACTSNCVGKECGDDGCGGSCGTCGIGLNCQNGVCGGHVPCYPNDCGSLGRNCGVDLCGVSCGDCGNGQVCDTSVWRCKPNIIIEPEYDLADTWFGGLRAGSQTKWDITFIPAGRAIASAQMCYYVNSLTNYPAMPGCNEFVDGCTNSCGSPFKDSTSGWNSMYTGCADSGAAHVVSGMGLCTHWSMNQCAAVASGQDYYACPSYTSKGTAVSSADCICVDPNNDGGCDPGFDYNAHFNFAAAFFEQPTPLAIINATVHRVDNQSWTENTSSEIPVEIIYPLTDATNVVIPEVNVVQYDRAAVNKYSCLDVTTQIQSCINHGDQNCSIRWEVQNLPANMQYFYSGNAGYPATVIGENGAHSPYIDVAVYYNNRHASSNKPYLNIIFSS